MGGVNTGTREVLNKVLDILEQGLRDITRARDTVIDTNKRDIADVSWIKVKDLLESQYILMVSLVLDKLLEIRFLRESSIADPVLWIRVKQVLQDWEIMSFSFQ